MPTGYTAAIYENTSTSLRDFILTCARAFGATIHQRDDGLDVRPEIPKVASFYRENLEEARRHLEELEGLSQKEIISRAEKAYLDSLRSWQKCAQDSQALYDRYTDMLLKVNNEWRAPTAVHERLRSFMRQQLLESREHDCWTRPAPKRQTPTKWYEEALASAYQSVRWREESLAEEEKRVAEATAWINALYDSLPKE